MAQDASSVLDKSSHEYVNGNNGHSEWRAVLEEWRLYLDRLMKTQVFIRCFIFSILLSVFLLILETDFSVETGPVDDPTPGECPLWIVVTNKSIIAFFVAELSARIFVRGSNFFTTEGILDFVMVMGDFFLALYDMIFGDAFQITFLRSIRLLRIMRIVRFMQQFQELKYMLNGMGSAFRSISWGMILVSLILLMWAIVGVQLLYPLSRKVVAKGLLSECERCPRAWSSVWNAFLTLSQTFLSGEVWRDEDMYIVEDSSWTLAIFLFAFSSVTLAAINLILAAIVDGGAKAREEAFLARTEAARQQEAAECEANSRRLVALFKAADDDENGTLSKNELLEGYDKNKQLAAALHDLGYERLDIEVVFDALDPYKQDSVSYYQLVKAMEDNKSADMHQMVIFVKFAVMHMWKVMEENQRGMKENQKQMKENQRQMKENQSNIKENLHSMQTQLSNLNGVAQPSYEQHDFAHNGLSAQAHQQKNIEQKQFVKSTVGTSRQDQKHCAKSRVRPARSEHLGMKSLARQRTAPAGIACSDLKTFSEIPDGMNSADSIDVVMLRNKELVHNMRKTLQQALDDCHTQNLSSLDQTINLLLDTWQPHKVDSHGNLSQPQYVQRIQSNAPPATLGKPGAAWSHLSKDTAPPKALPESLQPVFL